MDPVDALIARSLAAAAGLPPGGEVAFVAASYDTAFEPVADQVASKVAELQQILGTGAAARWRLFLVDDTPAGVGFAEAAAAGRGRHPADAERVHVVALPGVGRDFEGLKGRALRAGFAEALGRGPAAVAYVNLNLKVDARQAALGLGPVLAGQVDAAIGSRAAGDGGVVRGAGALGRIKSRAFSRIARAALPPLHAYADQNAPLKIFSPRAARLIASAGRVDRVAFDCEWLMLLVGHGLTAARFPVAWIQRAGSHPPWHLIGPSLVDLARVRRRWRRGGLQGDAGR
ncbi:MAG: hypothetical protein H6706_14665 [Myxococcales bacterium]|nr:hypothetical protein [Myxococcales bacterium]